MIVTVFKQQIRIPYNLGIFDLANKKSDGFGFHHFLLLVTSLIE